MQNTPHQKGKVKLSSISESATSKMLVFCLATLCGFFVVGCARWGFWLKPEDRPFCIIALPDTQLYSLYHPDIFRCQTQWIRANKTKMNIMCVVHEGDITHTNTGPEWRNVDRAIRVLEGVVPYCLAIGNHDMSTSGTAKDRDTALFDRFFPPARLSKYRWYGGHFANSIQNAYYLFHAGGMKFLVICLEFGPRDQVLEWANRVVSAHSDYRTIVVTHNYMYSDDTRSGEGDKWNPHGYGCKGNDGEEMWEKFVSKHENIFLVLSGHILNDGLGKQTSIGVHGNQVHELLANYQMKPNGGNGWLRIMKFVPRKNKIYVRTYSPWLNRWAKDPDNHFELDYRMR